METMAVAEMPMEAAAMEAVAMEAQMMAEAAANEAEHSWNYEVHSEGLPHSKTPHSAL